MPRSKNPTDAALEELRRFGLAFPGAHTKRPWPGHLDLAVKDKTFAYMSLAGEPFSISCKLPRSSDAALMLPFTTPTAYGLGKSGWVSAEFPEGMPVPVDLLKEWLEESYRAQAPARVSAGLPMSGGGAPSRRPAVRRPAPNKRSPKRSEATAEPAEKRRGTRAPAPRPQLEGSARATPGQTGSAQKPSGKSAAKASGEQGSTSSKLVRAKKRTAQGSKPTSRKKTRARAR
jgi:predicted DNA-binding protein (MmcQ/YjbR family)